MSKEITSRAQDYSQWYNDLVIKGSLADYSAVEVHGYKAIWLCALGKHEGPVGPNVQGNRPSECIFSIVCSKEFLGKRRRHAEGFAKECAVVTHYRLKSDPIGKGKINC